MRIEIMIDKEQKISQATLDALESELYRNLRPLYPKTAIPMDQVEAVSLFDTNTYVSFDSYSVPEKADQDSSA